MITCVRIVNHSHLKIEGIHLNGVINQVSHLLIHFLEEWPVKIQFLNHIICLLFLL
jgi:hypothetical protein